MRTQKATLSLHRSANSGPDRLILCSEFRHRLKGQLREGQFETLSEAFLGLIARIATTACFKRIQFGYWGAAAILFSVTSHWTSLLAFISSRSSTSKVPELWLVHFLGALVAILQLLSSRYYARRICRTLEDDVINQITRPEDLQDLSKWLKTTFNKTHQFRFCLLLSIALTLASIAGSAWMGRYDLINEGTIALEIVGWFQSGMGWYFLIPGATLSTQLARHEYDLFSPDPASSRLVVAITNMLYSALFVAVAIATLFSSGVFLIGRQNPTAQIAFLFLTAWGPIVLIIVVHHIAVMKIVASAKTHALYPIQAAVLEMQARIGSLNTGELDRLNKLLDLHKRIHGANILAIDWKGALVIVNTLLLPVASLLVQFLRSAGSK